VLTLALALTLVLAGCSKKDSSGGSAGGSSSGGSASVPKASGKAAPASDFSYDMSKDGKGVEIKGYSGNGGKVVIPAEIEGLPVVSVVGISDKDNGYMITSVVFPPNVKRIGYMNMFNGCDNLTSVTIQGTGVVIGQWGFAKCTELSELIFPDGENVLIPDPEYSYNNSFSDCKKLPLAIRAKLKDMGFGI
jgi:hypothetical protein